MQTPRTHHAYGQDFAQHKRKPRWGVGYTWVHIGHVQKIHCSIALLLSVLGGNEDGGRRGGKG